MKKIIYTIRYWRVWLFSRKVLDAINSGAPYEEVEALVLGMIGEKEKGCTPAKDMQPNAQE